jgi:MucR family transcriptional regulator, transcriptional regulator of exopolysaccharide biosynthesis
MNTNGNDPYLIAKIVSEYVSHHKLTASELSNLITTVHQAIGHLSQDAKEEEVRTPAVPVRRSVQRDYVVCLDCGFRAVTLRRHIRVQHDLTPDEYQQRWGLKNTHPLTAPAYSERRSTTAKALGFGRKPSTEIPVAEVAVESPMPIAAESETPPASKPMTRTRRATKTADGETKAEAIATPTKKARTRSRARVASKPDQVA